MLSLSPAMKLVESKLKERPPLTRNDWILITFCWLLTQILVYSIYGINSKEEALTYISLADNFVNGSGDFTLYRLWYSGYVGILVLIRMSGLPHETMYIIQLALSFVAVIYFTRIISLWTSSRIALVLSGILYSTCFIIQQWVTHLFTDAFFSMLLIIAIYYLLNENKSRRHRIVFWFLLLILPFFRPVGFLFILVACFHWIFNFQRENIYKILAVSVYIIFLLVLINRSIMESTGIFYPFDNLDANIICGLSSNNLLEYQVVPYTREMRITEYFLDNPEMTIRLFSYRFYKVFSMTRPFFSDSHNIIIAVACFVYYTLALIGFILIILKKKREQFFLLAGCLIFSIPSIIFCVEWHGRMSIPVLCFILIAGAIGIDKLINRWYKR